MQFKHPELLYALVLLLIPIIVHLFQLRKFKKEAFTNVAFLKKITIQTRKSSQIKKWLTLITRLLIFAGIIIAFAQPYTSQTNDFTTKNETIIYLDNSFSMQTKGAHGELLKRAVQDIISAVPESEDISLITNNQTFKNTTIKGLKNDLLQLDYSSNQLTYDAALLKSKKLFSNRIDTQKNLVFISDFQQKNREFKIENDSSVNYNVVKLIPVNNNNIFIDSLYISKTTPSNLELQVSLKSSGTSVKNIPVSLFEGSNLIAKTSVSIVDDKASTTFSVPANRAINGTIKINDSNLQFDDQLFFSINEATKINVLSINGSDDSFLSRIYTRNEFNYNATKLEDLNYNIIDAQNLIVINELNSLPSSLISVLTSFTNNGGYLLIIPSTGMNIQTYNNLLINYGSSSYNDITNSEKRITTINFSHPLYNNGVFEKQISNFQYPKVNSFYKVNSSQMSSVLQFEDSNTFLSQNANMFVCSSALNEENSNFKNSPLIVPTFYNIGKLSLKSPELYYTIGKENNFDVAIELQQDHILTLVNDVSNIIPQQQYFNNKIVITTSETPDIAGTYSINNENIPIKYVSYNHNKEESILTYQNLSFNNSNVILSDSIASTFETLKSNSKVNELWKWFVIFALIFLIIEMLILKYLK